MNNLKVAFVHDYLVQYGGAERTLEALMELYPDAPIYTGLYDSKNLSKEINKRKIIFPKNSILSRFPKYLTFLMPFVFESFDLREYDLVISDGTAWPKSVLTTPEQLHISYIHTPPRFLYGYSVESTKRNKWYFKPFVSVIDHMLRPWDFAAAQRPDYLLTNSKETKKRIKKFYKRDAKVIYPPVDIKVNHKNVETEPYYLLFGRLAAYKNFDLVIKAFNQLPFKLKVAGTGPEEEALKLLAGENIKFYGRVSEEIKSELFSNCLGLISPVEDEDLGIVPIEAMAYGKPVLAHKSGGHLETIKEGLSGEFFDELTLESFLTAFKKFDKNVAEKKYDNAKIANSVKDFGKERFQKEFSQFVDSKLKEFNA